MQGLLSFDQAPPLGVPLRFFLTAPCFAMAASVVLLMGGPSMLASRWTSEALAFTHLITAGFMLQIMLGALQQLFPVALGANFHQPERIAGWVHISITLGTALLASAFLTQQAWLFGAAMLLLGLGSTIFLGAAAQALRRVAWQSNPAARGFGVALVGLAVTIGLGLVLAGSLASGSGALPLLLLTQLHVSWGWVVWCGTLVASVALFVVPMFLVTPEYPRSFARYFALCLLAGTLAWTAGVALQWSFADTLLGAPVILALVVFCGLTIRLLYRSKRAKRETLHHFWMLGLLSALAACALWLLQTASGLLQQWHATPLLLAALVLMGACGSVMTGMLYKIVPFLVWQHLQNRGQGQVLAPNMKKVIPQNRMDRQLRLHLAACVLLIAAAIWPHWLVYPAAAALAAAQVVLLQNLLYARGIYQSHLQTIATALSQAPVSA